MTDKEGSLITDGYEGFVPVKVSITNNGVMTVTTAYSSTVVPNGVLPDTHKNTGSWPVLP